jgi:hypothetical protein
VAAEAEFTIGARASWSDRSCGDVRRLIIDPATDTVTHLVIRPGYGREAGRLVPVHLIDTAAGEIRLRCTLAQLDLLDHAEEFDLVEGPMPDSSDFVGGSLEYGSSDTAYASAGGAAQLVGVGPMPEPARTMREDVAPVGETDVDPVTVSLPSMARSGGAGLPRQPGRWPGDSCAAPGGASSGAQGNSHPDQRRDRGRRRNPGQSHQATGGGGTYHRLSDPGPASGPGSIPCESRDFGWAGGRLPSAVGARYSRLGLPVVILFQATVWDRCEGRLGTRRTGVPDGHENSLLHQLRSSGSIQGKSVDDRQSKCHISV